MYIDVDHVCCLPACLSACLQDYYKLLGVDPASSAKDIGKAGFVVEREDRRDKSKAPIG